MDGNGMSNLPAKDDQRALTFSSIVVLHVLENFHAHCPGD